nr:MAG TPA: hypothetical protein [Crassvirales sp.]
MLRYRIYFTVVDMVIMFKIEADYSDVFHQYYCYHLMVIQKI